MSQPPIITVTGFDAFSSPADLERLVKPFPMAEIGFLYTATPEGRNRYPDIDTLMVLLATVAHLGGRSAVHICGSKARTQLLAGELKHLTGFAHRVQVNGDVPPGQLWSITQLLPDTPIITQRTAHKNPELDVSMIRNHQILVDGSGGRGISPEKWLRPDSRQHCGFAGGLGPDNLKEQLPAILEAAGDYPFWVDMEGKLRDHNDRFDVEKAVQALTIFHEFIGAGASALGREGIPYAAINSLTREVKMVFLSTDVEAVQEAISAGFILVPTSKTMARQLFAKRLPSFAEIGKIVHG